MPGPPPPPARRVRERLSGTPRRVLAAGLLVLGTLLALTAQAPAAAGPVVVTTRTVDAGTVLAAADLIVTRRAVDERPDGALTTSGPALGRRAVAALPRGAVVTGTALAPEGFTADLAPGRAVATATVTAGRAGIVSVGDRVRLLTVAGPDLLDATAAPEPVTLTSDARVLALWPATGGETATLVVDVDVGAATRLAVLPPGALVGCVVVTA